jgi:hypothetical protein
VTEPTPYIDFENLPAPRQGFLVTHFITVRSVARSRAFYSQVLGGHVVVLEENPCIVKLSNSWLLMNPGSPPTPDKAERSATRTIVRVRMKESPACLSGAFGGRWDRSASVDLKAEPVETVLCLGGGRSVIGG